MKIEEVKNIVNEYLNLIESDTFPVNVSELSLVLDKLALISNDSFDSFFDEKEYPDSPQLDDIWIRDILLKKFPTLDMYNLPVDISSKLSESELGIGHSHDDIGDIYRDLKEVDWKFNNTSVEDALWQFNWSYQNHFGTHLRNLQWYLFNSRYEGNR